MKHISDDPDEVTDNDIITAMFGVILLFLIYLMFPA